jgi:hypothetical protein
MLCMELKLIITLLYQQWNNKMYINKKVEMLQCPSDIKNMSSGNNLHNHLHHREIAAF